jgi:ABC-type antimicrobial peptide transport system ATPase subunit
VRRADQILVVEGGRIIERGTHETLYQPPAAAITTSTRNSTGCKRICSWRRAKAIPFPKAMPLLCVRLPHPAL